MNIIRQPLGSNICGHCCLSVISGETIDTTIKLLGHENEASPFELAAVLREMEIKHIPQLKRAYENSVLPNKAILKVVYPKHDKSHMHWVTYNNGLIYDSSARRGGIYALNELKNRYLVEVKIASYMEIL